MLALSAVALLGGGCTEAGQRRAQRAVEQQAHVARAHCTRGARVYIEPIPTTVYICQSPVGDARCDEYRVRLRRQRPAEVELQRRGIDCLLPPS